MATAIHSTRGPLRPLLPFAFRPAAPVAADLSSDELLLKISRIIDGQERPDALLGAADRDGPLLPSPAPLPSLTSALSRRRDLFGAVASEEAAA